MYIYIYIYVYTHTILYAQAALFSADLAACSLRRALDSTSPATFASCASSSSVLTAVFSAGAFFCRGARVMGCEKSPQRGEELKSEVPLHVDTDSKRNKRCESSNMPEMVLSS